MYYSASLLHPTILCRPLKSLLYPLISIVLINEVSVVPVNVKLFIHFSALPTLSSVNLRCLPTLFCSCVHRYLCPAYKHCSVNWHIWFTQKRCVGHLYNFFLYRFTVSINENKFLYSACSISHHIISLYVLFRVYRYFSNHTNNDILLSILVWSHLSS